MTHDKGRRERDFYIEEGHRGNEVNNNKFFSAFVEKCFHGSASRLATIFSHFDNEMGERKISS